MRFKKQNFRAILLDRKGSVFWLAFAIVIIFGFIVYAYINSIIPDFFYGEEYDKIVYPATNGHLDSWLNYFYAKGRPVEGIYWTYLYKLVRYSPKTFHLFSLLLHFAASFAASIAVLRVLARKSDAPRWASGALLLSLFFGPYMSGVVSRISFDAASLAIFTLFVSVLCMQSWFESQFTRPLWLVGGLISFLITIANYEIAAFLFPVALILAIPLLDFTKVAKPQNLFIALAFGGLASMFLVLIPLRIYASIGEQIGRPLAHPALLSRRPPIYQAILDAPAAMLTNLGNFGGGLSWVGDLEKGFISLLAIATLLSWLFWLAYRIAWESPKAVSTWLGDSMFCTGLAGVWLMVLGLAPYALAGYGTTARAYFASVFGLTILLNLAVLQISNWRFRRLLFGILLAWVLIGVQAYFAIFAQINDRRADNFDYFLEITEVIGELRGNSNLVLINHVRSTSGCGSSFSALYGNRNIVCATLSTTDPASIAHRYESEIDTRLGGRLRNDNNVLLAFNEDGEAYIIPSITPEDDFLIIWHSLEPIRTDYRRINEFAEHPETEMYYYLVANR